MGRDESTEGGGVPLQVDSSCEDRKKEAEALRLYLLMREMRAGGPNWHWIQGEVVPRARSSRARASATRSGSAGSRACHWASPSRR